MYWAGIGPSVAQTAVHRERAPEARSPPVTWLAMSKGPIGRLGQSGRTRLTLHTLCCRLLCRASPVTDQPDSLDPAPSRGGAVILRPVTTGEVARGGTTHPTGHGLLPIERLIKAIRNGDEAMVEGAVLSLSQRSRWLAPLALVVGAFAMLFQGVKLLFTNWRLTLVEILPAMWIWAAMLDLKVHVLHGKEFHIIRGPVLIPIVLAVAGLTAASFFLNAVFAFAIAQPGHPEIRSAMAQARDHLRPVLAWGFAVGLALAFSTLIASRWGKGWFAI